MNEQRAIQFLNEVRKPLLVLHKAILDHERAAHEREFGPVTPAAFLQALINGSGFRWLTPFSSVIANVDETLDDKKASPEDRLASVDAVRRLFATTPADNPFIERYQALLQESPAILHAHSVVAQILRGIETA
ncbi:hypothetical protein QS306_15455 [Paraburkholderia bonniea]|uniref:hypothetical protein n=1 Tax=Paraburkholderia bonniea TaxID=2152891 RepID=UPI0012920CB5|nr:hypothetical protein [Paraburkholderia bonniea]WJF92151.1 hypothetical protein QS306_15455 [Paraburkholderia bonniea]WJF95471.1 hypothetical protein QS308_15460 [Paraburkholderia bonniea]